MPLRNQIRADAEQALSAIAGSRAVEVKLDAMSCDERDALAGRLRQRDQLKQSLFGPGSHTRTIAMASGKGGVGKSTVTVNLATALAAQGHAVALIDADVYGPTVPLMMGLPAVPPETHEGKMVPPEAHGVKVVSMGFFLPDNEPVVWRGPMLGRAIEQFLGDVLWGSPDYLFIDLPPGTGDIALTIAQMIPGAELIIVTTPQEAAARTAIKAAKMAADDQTARPRRRREHGLLRVSRLRQPPLHLRPRRRVRDRPPHGHALLGRIPLDEATREGGDNGLPAALDPSSPVGAAFADIARALDESADPRRGRRSGPRGRRAGAQRSSEDQGPGRRSRPVSPARDLSPLTVAPASPRDADDRPPSGARATRIARPWQANRPARIAILPNSSLRGLPRAGLRSELVNF